MMFIYFSKSAVDITFAVLTNFIFPERQGSGRKIVKVTLSKQRATTQGSKYKLKPH